MNKFLFLLYLILFTSLLACKGGGGAGGVGGDSTDTLSYDGATGTSGLVGVAMSVAPTTLNNNGVAITNCVATPALSVGLSIDPSTCVISGTPSGILASTTYSIETTNSAGTSSAALVTISVGASVPTLSYYDIGFGFTKHPGIVGEAMSVAPNLLNNNGAAITNCAANPALSVGLSIDPSTCVISGMPSGILASTTYSIEATNSAGTFSAALVTISVISVPTLSYSDSAGNVGVAMSVAPTTLNSNGAAITGCSVYGQVSLSSIGLSFNPSTCVISGTPSGILASTTYSIYATNSVGISSAASVTISVGASTSCPTNYAMVPANSSLGITNPFCVARFEMKNVSNNATSQAASTPWVSISQTNAKTACTALNGVNGVTNKYDLISNPEWMTIAREIEKTATNWSSGIVGTGMLNRGHSDSSPFSALAVTNTDDPYIGTGNNSGQAAGSGWEQKRTHTLSNGQVIWDFAGNVYEWVDWSSGGGLTPGPTSCVAAWTQFPDVSCGALAAADYMPGNPAGVASSNYNSNYGLGYFLGGDSPDQGGTRRGGVYSQGAIAGIFTLDLNPGPGYTLTTNSFRCVFRP
jgi:hypothetical protein